MDERGQSTSSVSARAPDADAAHRQSALSSSVAGAPTYSQTISFLDWRARRSSRKSQRARKASLTLFKHVPAIFELLEVATVSKRPKIDDIQRAFAARFCLSRKRFIEHRYGGDRSVHPRNAAMLCARYLTQNSSTYIGQRFGGRDHTTVLNACRSAHRQMARDAKFARKVETTVFQLLVQAQVRAAA